MALQAGFVGCGNITDTHARAAREAGLGVAAFHGRDLREGRGARRALRRPAPSRRYEEFLAHRPMDLVVIGSPSALHAEQGIAAAERGLHVLVEKPIDVTLAKGRGARRRGRARRASGSACCSRTGSKPELVRAARASSRRAASGACCSPRRASSGTGRPSTTRPRAGAARTALDGGGALINQGVHTVDLLLWLLGDVDARQRAHRHDAARDRERGHGARAPGVRVGRVGDPRGDDRGLARLPAPRRDLRDRGDGRRSRATASSPPTCAGRRPSWCRQGPSGAVSAADGRPSPTRRRTGGMIEDFVRAIETGGAPACDGREGLRSLAVVEAVYRAARERRRGGRDDARPAPPRRPRPRARATAWSSTCGG